MNEEKVFGLRFILFRLMMVTFPFSTLIARRKRRVIVPTNRALLRTTLFLILTVLLVGVMLTVGSNADAEKQVNCRKRGQYDTAGYVRNVVVNFLILRKKDE